MALAHAGEDHGHAHLVHLHRRDGRPRADDRRVADALHLVADGGAAPLEDVERDDEARLLRGGPHGLPHLVPHGHRRAPRDEHGAVQAERGAVAELVRRELGVVVGETPEPVVATGLGAVELGDVLVVRVIDGGEQRVVRDAGVREEAARDADDPVDHLRLDAVALLVLPALDRIRRSCLLARGEARLGEDPTALAARHAGAVHAVRAEHGVARHPPLAPVTLDDARHRAAPRRRHARGEGVGRKIDEVHVAVRRHDSERHRPLLKPRSAVSVGERSPAHSRTQGQHARR